MDEVLRLTKARNCLNKISSEYNNLDEFLYFVLLAVIDNIPLLPIGRNCEDIHSQINDFRINILNLLCLETLYNRYQNNETEEEDITSFRNEKWK